MSRIPVQITSQNMHESRLLGSATVSDQVAQTSPKQAARSLSIAAWLMQKCGRAGMLALAVLLAKKSPPPAG